MCSTLIFFFYTGNLDFRSYSTNVNNSVKNINNLPFSDIKKFYQWFVGFADAESNFTIHPIYNENKSKVTKFSFMFNIELHIDDLNILILIKDILNIGNIRINKDKCTFTVSNRDGILVLIQIFDKYNLNTTKYLDYLDFKKAFNLYFNRDNNLTDLEIKDLFDQILSLKNGMNTKRTDFTMPLIYKIIITDLWLLGFIEGDASFFISRTDLDPMFTIELSESQLPTLLKVKEYLENTLNFDKHSKYKLANSKVIGISNSKVRKGKPTVTLVIRNIYVLNNFLIPLLDSMTFLTKKGLDFNDYKLICSLIYKGSHRIDDIKDLIIKLSYTMNNYRLTTCDTEVELLSKKEMNKLVTAKATIENLPDGRVLDLLSNTVISNSLSCVYEVITPAGDELIFDTMKEVLGIVDVGFRTLKKHLDQDLRNKDAVIIKGYSVKRIPVFHPSN